MLRDGQSKMAESVGVMNPLSKMPGFDAMQAQQQAFFKAMTGGMMGATKPEAKTAPEPESDDLDDIKAELAALQAKLSKLGK